MRMISLEKIPEVASKEILRCFDPPNKRVHCHTERKQKRSSDDMNSGAESSVKFCIGIRKRLTQRR